MTKIITAIFLFAFVAGCSVIPDNPRVSFGKKCSEIDEGQVAYSWLWIYNGDAGLNANKEICKDIDG
jgi:hypothetical protein|tara:strand:+ start:212 stop:412 length:201 start_codon:yes stop_codon:yes gene_type:complete